AEFVDWPTERAESTPNHEARATASEQAVNAVKPMVHHSARTGASSRALGAHTTVCRPVNPDHAYASSAGRPSESTNSDMSPRPVPRHRAGGSSFPTKLASWPDRAMMRCAASETLACQPGGSPLAATRPARAFGLGDLARA